MQQHSALTLGAGSAVSYPSDHLVAKGVCVGQNDMYGDALRFLFDDYTSPYNDECSILVVWIMLILDVTFEYM